MARDHFGSDLFRVAVRRQVGTGKQHLSAASPIGTSRSSAMAFRTVHGTTTTATPTSKSAALAPDLRQSTFISLASTTKLTSKATPRYSGRTRANAPNRARAGAARQMPWSRGPKRREHRPREQRRRQRLSHQHALVRGQRGVDRDRGGADQAAPAKAGGRSGR